MTDTPTPKMTVYGAPWCPDCRRAKQFLGEQRVPYDWIDIDLDDEARDYVQRVNDGKQIIPTIVFEDGSILVEPENSELAVKLGIGLSASRTHYDLIVVGGGPAGLTAALYAAREGIDTLIIERSAVGGQAGVTERIENYPGFPDGVQGAHLADQMRLQAERFGVEILQAQSVAGVRAMDNFKVVSTETGDEYSAGALIVATGSRYRRLDVPGEDDLIGAGIHFCATCDGPFYRDEEVVVIGGGNSAVEEGLFLTRFASKVTLLVRGEGLRASRILQERVENSPKIEIRTNTSVREFRGSSKVESVVVADSRSGETDELHPFSSDSTPTPAWQPRHRPIRVHRHRHDVPGVSARGVRGGRRPRGQHQAACLGGRRRHDRRHDGQGIPGAPPANARLLRRRVVPLTRSLADRKGAHRRNFPSEEWGSMGTAQR